MTRNLVAGVATLLFAAFTIGLDLTGVLLLTASIENEFTVDITTTQWVLNLYALTYAVLMITGGRLGDMYGRRRMMLIATGLFAVASIGCLFAPTIGWLIAARGVQGAGAAMMWPSILAIGANLVPAERRGWIMGLILAGVTSGNVFGPLIGGFVAWVGDWRLFFLVNLMMAIVVALLVLRFLPKDPPETAGQRVDVVGIALLAGAVGALLYGLDVGPDWGWASLAIVGIFVLSAVLFVLFPLAEHRVADPMVPPPLMQNRDFLLALTTNGLLVPSIFLAFLYFPQYFQKVLGWSVLAASFGMLPLMVLLSVGAILAGRLYDSIGPRRLLLAGYVLIALGGAWIVVLPSGWGYVAMVPAMVLIGLGGAMGVGSAGTVAVSAVAPTRTGVAGGLSFTVHLACGAVGVAGGTAILYLSSTQTLQRGLSEAGIAVTPADQATLNAAAPGADATARILGTFTTETATAIQNLMTTSFAQGLSHAYWLALGAALVGLVCVIAIDEKKLKNADAAAPKT
ncbi:MFS transporter [Bauldia sp.]|uniref:MFS transporter n=1 Tax=Bauldia sp. TaxID=2575872 RepID=UPI003BA87968